MHCKLPKLDDSELIAPFVVKKVCLLNKPTKNGRYAVGQGDVDLVTTLLTLGSKDVGDHKGQTALMRAASQGRVDLMKLLVEKTSDVRARDYVGYDALFFAIEANQPEAARFLIDHGADVNASDASGDKPIDLATKSKNKKIIDMLRKAGAGT